VRPRTNAFKTKAGFLGRRPADGIFGIKKIGPSHDQPNHGRFCGSPPNGRRCG
jgi:hypothetical protein